MLTQLTNLDLTNNDISGSGNLSENIFIEITNNIFSDRGTLWDATDQFFTKISENDLDIFCIDLH